MSTDLLSSLGFDLTGFGDEDLAPTGDFTRFSLNQRSSFRGNINGVERECIGVLKGGRLTRLTKLTQEPKNGRPGYSIVSGMITPITMEFSIIDSSSGNEVEIALEELLRNWFNASRADQPEMNAQRFRDGLHNIGLYLDGEMTMTWQHMGADDTKIEEHFDWFKSHGATDVTEGIAESRRGRIQTALEHADGIAINRIDVGRQDRGQSATQQGFLDFVNAQIDNFSRYRVARKEVLAIQARLSSEEKLSDEQRRDLAAAANTIQSNGRSWMNNLAGAQEEKHLQVDGSIVNTGIWRPVSAPIGRIGVTVGEDQTHLLDFWKNNNSIQNAASVSEIVVDSTSSAMSDSSEDEPF